MVTTPRRPLIRDIRIAPSPVQVSVDSTEWPRVSHSALRLAPSFSALAGAE
jgi:hypothetical protein